MSGFRRRRNHPSRAGDTREPGHIDDDADLALQQALDNAPFADSREGRRIFSRSPLARLRRRRDARELKGIISDWKAEHGHRQE